jgi:hypothetical protein
MSVLIEAFTVVIRQSTLADKYPDGLNGYRRDCPNARFCADDHLCAISFMVVEDAQVFIARLATKGIPLSQSNSTGDVALVDSSIGQTIPCDWLELDNWGQTHIAWLRGTGRGNFHAPASWNADNQLQHFSQEEASQRLEFVRTDGRVDVYRDKLTGKALYAGRTTSAAEASQHNALFKRASDISMPLILTHGLARGRLS